MDTIDKGIFTYFGLHKFRVDKSIPKEKDNYYVYTISLAKPNQVRGCNIWMANVKIVHK